MNLESEKGKITSYNSKSFEDKVSAKKNFYNPFSFMVGFPI